MIRDSCCRKTIFLLVILFSLFLVPITHAIDADDDGQHRPQDCNDNNYYKYYDAPEIPFDGLGNHCPNTRDSKLYDMNDLSAPSNNAIYYVGDTIQLIGYNFSYNKQYLIAIADADNRVSFGPNPTRIDSIYINDTVKKMNIYTDSTGKVNESLYLPYFNPVYGEIEPYALGTWTIYFYFTPYNTSQPGYREYIPIETFTVVDRETCNGIDDDLDGVIDNGFDLDNDEFTSCGGDCNDNDNTINPDATDTSCDNIDNNCNGQIDEDYITTQTTCGVGACQNTGQYVCTNGNEQNTCNPLASQTEICDNIDNNCNGQTDENLYQNANAFGICSTNTQTCNAGNWIDNIETEPIFEICDNLDNDCDGTIDENLFQIYGTNDIGICSLGTKTCSTGIWNINTPSLEPQLEICDGLDNDCDGFIDENNICGLSDDDNDGVPNEFDLCEKTTPWFAYKKNKNHYDSNNMYLTATYGCNCKQILDCKPGNNKGEYKSGCTQGTLDAWIEQDAWAKECKPEKEIQIKERKTENTKPNNNHLEENKKNDSFNESENFNETENKTPEVENKTENNSFTNTTEFIATNNESYINNETKTPSENNNNQNDIITQHIEKETKDYPDTNENEYTKTNNNENNEIINTEQENTIKTAKSKNQFWDIPSILKQSISNIFRAFGLNGFF